MFFNILAIFAKFEAYLIKQRTRVGNGIARAKGNRCGKQHKLAEQQQQRSHACMLSENTPSAMMHGVRPFSRMFQALPFR